MLKGNSAFLIGVMTVVIAVGALGYILYSVTSYADTCQGQQTETCSHFTGPSFPFLLIILISAGLVLVSSTVVYILVTA